MDVAYSNDNRIKWVDILKGYAILAVMIGHLVQYTYIGDFVYSFSLPLFIFASGFLHKSYNSFKEFLVHKAKSLIIPYIIFGLPFPIIIAYNNVLISDMSTGFLISPKDYFLSLKNEIIGYLIQIRYQVIWYIAFIFLVCIAMYFILLIKRKWLQVVIIFPLVIAGGIYYTFGGEAFIWNIDIVPMALPFYYAGYLLSSNDKWVSKISNLDSKKTIVLFFAFLIGNNIFNVITNYIGGASLDMYNNEYGCIPITYLSAFLGIVAFLILSMGFRFRLIEYMGRHSLMFYLLHLGVFHVFNSIYPILHIPSLWELVGSSNYNLYDYPLILGLMVLYFVPSFIVIWLIIKLFSHTPLRKYF